MITAASATQRLRRLNTPVLIVLVGAIFRITALTVDVRFLPDEALFTTFARDAAVYGEWLLPGPLDKPPLAIYANALALTLFVVQVNADGVLDFPVRLGEFAARVPNVFAGIILIAVVYALARQLYRDRVVAAWAALLVACAPPLIRFSASAFTDSLMLLFMTTSLLAAVRGRLLWSGVWLMLGIAAKPQAIYALPLLLALKAALIGRFTLRETGRFALPLLIGAGALLIWDLLRAPATSWWALALANNNPARLIRANEVGPRLLAWVIHGRFVFGTATIAFLVAPLLTISTGIIRQARSRAPRRATLIDMLLLTFALAYLLLHWLVAFNTYERYLLPLLPPLALIGARGSVALWRGLGRYITGPELTLLAGAFAFALITSGFDGGRLPDPARAEQAGIDEVAAYLNDQPVGTIIYDRWLGWQLGYYLGPWTDKRRVYHPTPGALVRDAAQQPDPAPRFFPAPADQPVGPWLTALRAAGFTVELDLTLDQFVVYRLLPP
ncbi:MAG: phospholipid carrier-dependent glycosyltransferase [Chloroflexi bacterium]|nr:phospholipid carrier-dependent glycosyltransferase [Chloroflexota bacterium]